MARKQSEARSIQSAENAGVAPVTRRRSRPKSKVAPAEAPVPTIAQPAEPTVAGTLEAETGREISVDGRTAVSFDGALAHEEIARLAYAYWEARGCQGGSAEEDWARAEEELRCQRAGR